MKIGKRQKVVINLLVVFVLLASVCFLLFFGAEGQEKSVLGDNYNGSFHEGNYVWGGAMNLAWNELSENIIKEEIVMNTEDEDALRMVRKLNNSVFTKNDLDESSYYVKSGYGQKTVDLINKESREKFPNKSFEDLKINLDDTEIISYAYFLKEVEYRVMFNEKKVEFDKNEVKGFSAENSEQRGNVEIVKYWNDDKFILSLKLKDNFDKIFIAKGFDGVLPSNLVKVINEEKGEVERMKSYDKFEMPNLHFDFRRDYKELVNKFFMNSDFSDYYIDRMYEKIKFDMDYRGARVENEAVIDSMLWGGYVEKKNIPKKLILDKKFWVVMQRADSDKPYFVLKVNNSKIMKK